MTSLNERTDAATAQRELAYFFTIATTATQRPEMFSRYIDAEWHRMLQDPADYADFCHKAVGQPVGHSPDRGSGTPSWLSAYHRQYGQLPAVWFADADGVIDRETYGDYRKTGTVITSWDCTPTTNDPDYSNKKHAQTRVQLSH